MVKTTIIHVILSVAVARGWPLCQLDVNNAFLQGHLFEDVFMAQPLGFIDPAYPSHVCHLKKAIYGLKQAPRAWYNELRQHLLQTGFVNSLSDSSLFIFNKNGCTLLLLVYVDNIIVTGSDVVLVDKFVASLSQRFSIKDLGYLSYFLGVEVLPSPRGLFLSQQKYVIDLLTRTKMLESKPVQTPLPTDHSLTLLDGTSLTDAIEFRSVVGRRNTSLSPGLTSHSLLINLLSSCIAQQLDIGLLPSVFFVICVEHLATVCSCVVTRRCPYMPFPMRIGLATRMIAPRRVLM